MGYYTSYELNIKPEHPKKLDAEALEREINRLNVFEGGDHDIGWYGNVKWYDHDDDMLLLSSRFPDIIFELRGDGENSDDLWIHYYKNGAVMYDGLEIIAHDFDINRTVKPKILPTKYSYES